MRKQDQIRQMRFEKPRGRPLRSLQPTKLQIGGKSGPHLAQGLSDSIDVILSRDFSDVELEIIHFANNDEEPNLALREIAQHSAPAKFQLRIEQRRDLLGERQARSFFNRAYLDDENAQVLGFHRGILFYLCHWGILEIFDLPVAVSKEEIGNGLVYLGLEFLLALGRTISSRDKPDLIDEWITRVCNQRTIERLELFSLLLFIALLCVFGGAW